MQAGLNCRLTSNLREENHSLKQSSTQEAFKKNEELLSFALYEVVTPKQISKKNPEMLDKKEMNNFCVQRLKGFQAHL